MLRFVTPHLQLKSVLELEIADLQARGLDGLLLDVDCTLKDHHAQDFRPEILDWVGTLRAGGIRLCLLSNGRPARIERLAAPLDLPPVAPALKPPPRCL